ncbi:MAG: cation:proton antiporter [Proteobacteria bacterium]|nr:cation:proton antiporter [Pseudomonadota bacterium]MBU1737733.1 cation:proton antiporter [Pseudomonadota bacterium]
MQQVTMAFALLLGAGLVMAQIGKLLKLPSVTGYILAGVLLGPSGFGLISGETSGDQLRHFSEIALMLIAFGIGEQIEFKEVKKVLRSVGYIGVGETTGSFILVAVSCYLVAVFSGVGGGTWQFVDYLVLALLLGAISVATAPATTLHVTRELGARGPLTSTLLAVVAVDNGLAIMYFGFAVAAVNNLLVSGNGSFAHTVLVSLREIGFSLLLGASTGMVIGYVLHRLKNKGEMLSAGLALLLLCGESARMLHLSPLLAGMAAGCTIINHDKRDVRLFRAVRDFEPPVHILFFTLAGSHLNLAAVSYAGWLGLAYFLFRIVGKISGAWLGGKAAGAPRIIQSCLGHALTPQAGVAIGLVFLVSGNPALSGFAEIITPVVLTGVVLSELVGPILTRFALHRAGETGGVVVECGAGPSSPDGSMDQKKRQNLMRSNDGVVILPWTWKKLVPPAEQDGVVIFGASHYATVGGLARLATIIAHYFHALPMAVRVQKPKVVIREPEKLFFRETDETRAMGYPLLKKLVRDKDVADGISSAVLEENTKCLILGYPIEGTIQGFQKVVEQVAEKAVCPVVVIRFYGILHTERILVPLADMEQLEEVSAIVKALSLVGEHSITLLRLLPYDHPVRDVADNEKILTDWIAQHEIVCKKFCCKIVSSDSRLETIYREAENHDLVVMGAPKRSRFQRLIFGSLAEAVSKDCHKPMLIVHNPEQTP